MNLIELEKQIKKYKIIEKFKDGVADGLLHGERDGNQSHHYYNQGYDYGCVMFDMLGTNVCRTKINDEEKGFNLQEVDTILDSLDFRLRLGQNKGKDQTRKLYKYFESMKTHLEGE